MSKVYVVQQQKKRDHGTGELVDRFDLSAAADYGSLVFLLGPQATPLRPRPTLAELRAGLEEFTGDDYLLLIGNPCLIGWAVALAAEASGGRVRLLQWHSHSGSYLVIDSQVFSCPAE